MTLSLNLYAGWLGFLAGAVSGALIGLFFHRDDWIGGYDSWTRRLLRLGHIACFGLGLINVLFALSAASLPSSAAVQLGSGLLVIGMITMPLNCFLSAPPRRPVPRRRHQGRPRRAARHPLPRRSRGACRRHRRRRR